MPHPTKEEAEKYHKHQHNLEIFDNVTKDPIWKLLRECWKEDIRELQRKNAREKDETQCKWQQGRIQQLEDCLDYAKTKIVEAREYIASFQAKHGKP